MAITITTGNIRIGSSTSFTFITGNLTVSKAVSAPAFNNTSDYRIKSNIQPINANIDLLNPISYDNKLTNSKDMGFIAHEVQEIIPELVHGEKDGQDYQSINYIGMIPILVKEVPTSNPTIISFCIIICIYCFCIFILYHILSRK